MYVLNQSALPIIHGINGDKQRGGWEDRDLENDCVCVCVAGCDNYIYCIGLKWPIFGL